MQAVLLAVWHGIDGTGYERRDTIDTAIEELRRACEQPPNELGGKAKLHDLLGLDHSKLVYRYGGRDFRFTNIQGNVIHDIVA